MKVGIISMQRVCNYGSFLQAYGLKKIIESLGHEVIFIDYKVGLPICNDSKDKKLVFKKKISNICLSFFERIRVFDFIFPTWIRQSLKENRLYKKACKEHLGFTNKKKYHVKVDAVVIGSDEVFNCTQLNPIVGYSPELFGKNANASIIVSYAASFGNTTMDKIISCNLKKELTELLARFNSISVRDENSLNIINKIICTKASKNLDPVLVYDFENDVKNVCSLNNFIIIYAYRNRIIEKEKELIKEFAQRNNKKIVCIGGYQDFGNIRFIGSPFEVLDYFRKADYVFTDTFHGTIMSVIYHKKFVTFVRKSKDGLYGNAEKLEDLLHTLKLDNRVVTDHSKLEEQLKQEIDYSETDKVLNFEKNAAKDYLKNVLRK